MHQSTTPSLSQTIWPRCAWRHFLTFPIVQTLLTVTFAYSLSSEAVVMRNWGDERGCDEGHWHTHTRGLPWGLPEVGTVQQVHCSRWGLLPRLLNTPTASLQRGKTSVLDITLNNLMVRFQQCWSFGDCGVPLHCHRSQVHSGPEW